MTYRPRTPEDTRTVRPGVLSAVPSVDRRNQGNIPPLSAATAAALQFPSLTDGRRVGRGAAVVNAGGSGGLVYMIYGTKIASVRCNFTHQLRLRLNQNRGSEKHDEREQKSAFQCSNTNKITGGWRRRPSRCSFRRVHVNTESPPSSLSG